MPDVLLAETTQILAVVEEAAQILAVVEEAAQVLAVAEQGPVGPQGPPGPPGPIGDASGALLVTNRLSELATDPQAQTDAQANLGLGATDPLAYYILAKA